MRRLRLRSLVFIGSLALVALTAWSYQEYRSVLASEVTAWTQDQSADCAVVLTGGPGRVREGFDLLAQARVKKLIISGVFPGAQLKEIFPEWPFYGPISEEDVVLERRSSTTFGNAQQTQPLVEALRCQSIILITSRLHMYRASRIFRRVFPVEVTVYDRAIVSGDYFPHFLDVGLETLKSMFYSIWAY